MKEPNFKSMFFRLYDRKISEGVITFSQLGISKMDFTKLCVEDDFAFDEETIRRVSRVMKLTEKEEEGLIEAAKRCTDI